MIHDPLGQTHNHVSSEHCFLLFCFSRFEKWGRTDVPNLTKLTLGWPSGSIIAIYLYGHKYLSTETTA